MSRASLRAFLRVAVGLALLLALLPAVSQAANTAPMASGTLAPGGGWAAYSFNYLGDFSKLGVMATYNTGDDPLGEPGFVVEIFAPNQDPSQGNRLGVASRVNVNPDDGTKNAGPNGVKYFQIENNVPGNYMVILHNWDSLSRPLQFTLRTVAVGEDSDIATIVGDANGPTLTAISSQGLTQVLGVSTETAVPAAPPAAAPAPAAPAAAQAGVMSGTLAARNAWAAFTFSYASSDVKVGVLATYDTANDANNKDASFQVYVYGPESTPPGGTPQGTASRINVSSSVPGASNPAFGEKFFQLTGNSGNYTVIVQNWSGTNLPIHYTLQTVSINTDFDYSTGADTAPMGPSLTQVGSGG